MPESRAVHKISEVQRRWFAFQVARYIILSLAAAILLVTLLHEFFHLSWWWGLPVFIVVLVATYLLSDAHKVNQMQVAMYLNQRYPQLEESTELLFRPQETLNLLEQLQVNKVAQALDKIHKQEPFEKALKWPLVALFVVMVICAIMLMVPYTRHASDYNKSHSQNAADVIAEHIMPDVSSVQVSIQPPAYTGLAIREQQAFNIKAEQGSEVIWHINTTKPVDHLELVVNQNTVMSLHAADETNKVWTIQKVISAPGFYQVQINGQRSDLYKIEVIKDVAPVVVIQQPKSYTVIDYGQPQKVDLHVAITDDYDIRNASISATISSGSGEAVKFKEQQIVFGDFKAGGRQYSLRQMLDLQALGMHPGDELYFYVKAVDNFNQETRSDVYMVTLPDTAQLMSLEGMATSLNIKPEYFRSQRQIIIETEQLLKDQKTITVDAFNNKSNDLGIDQKLLRMRYSKFLGEENEGNIGEEHNEHDHGSEHNETKFGDAKEMMDEVTHKHDNAEDADFFDAETKKQLKATLAEMWNAELKLRTFNPQEALPFEYKALRLLKDLQEKGRSYVQKAGVKTTPLKPEKRLTGDLSKVEAPVSQANYNQQEDPEAAVRKAIGLLEQLASTGSVDEEGTTALHQASLQLNRKASAEPSIYLTAVGAMNRVLDALALDKVVSTKDIRSAQKGLQKMVSRPAALPRTTVQSPDLNLSQQYFRNLKRMNP